MEEIDPIEELHEIRRKLIEKAGGTLDAYVRRIMEQQKQNPEGLVDFSKPTARKAPRTKATVRKSGARRKVAAP